MRLPGVGSTRPGSGAPPVGCGAWVVCPRCPAALPGLRAATRLAHTPASLSTLAAHGMRALCPRAALQLLHPSLAGMEAAGIAGLARLLLALCSSIFTGVCRKPRAPLLAHQAPDFSSGPGPVRLLPIAPGRHGAHTTHPYALWALPSTAATLLAALTPHTPHIHTRTCSHTCTHALAITHPVGLPSAAPAMLAALTTHTHHIHKHTYKHTHTTHTYTYVFTHVRTCTRNHASHGRRRYSHVPRNHLRRTLANARVRINTLQLSDDVLAGVSRAIMGRLDIVDLVGRNTADEFAERVGRCALWGALLQAPTLAHAWPHVCRGLSPPWTLLPTPLLAAPCLHFVPRALCLPLPQQLCGSECQKVFSVVGVAPLFTNNTHLLFILTPADTRGPAGPGN